MSRIVSLAVLVAVIVLVGILFYKVMVGFLVPVFLAVVLVVVFRPLHRWVLNETGNREHLAAGLTTFMIMLVVLIPIGFALATAAIQGTALVADINETSAKLFLERMRNKFGLQNPDAAEIKRLRMEIEQLQSVSASIVSLEDGQQKIDPIIKRVSTEIGELERKVLERPGSEGFKDDFEGIREALALLVPPFEVPVNSVQESDRSSDEENEADSPQEMRELSVMELQERVIQFGKKWRGLRETLMGGGTMAFFKEISNPSDQEIADLFKTGVNYLQPKLLSFGSATGAFIVQFIIGTGVLIISLYFFLYDGPSMVKAVMQLSPLDNRYEQQLLAEFDRVSRAIVVATILSAVAQGLTAGIGYYFVGMNSLVLLVFVTTMCALIPFVGPALVWVPVCLYVGIYEDRLLAASLLACWGMIVVGSVDNVVKVFVLHGQSQLHPLLALLSVLGGVQALGAIGIVVGPMAVVMLQTLLGILQHELSNLDSNGVPIAESSEKPLPHMVKKFKERGKKMEVGVDGEAAPESEPSTTEPAYGTSASPSSDATAKPSKPTSVKKR